MCIMVCILSGCNHIEVEPRENALPKVHILIPYKPCKIRGKHDGIHFKCKWKIQKTTELVKQPKKKKWKEPPQTTTIRTVKVIHQTYNLDTNTFNYE